MTRKYTRQLKRTSVRAIEGRSKEEQDTLEQNIMFENIWKPLFPHQRVCYETGRRLFPDENGNPYTTYFHHVLPKSLYPQFRFSPWNIVLVSFDTHSQLHTSPQLCKKIHALYLHYMSMLSKLEP